MKSVEMTADGAHDEAPDKPKLLEILRDEEQFELFIQFMFRDFTSEAILGFIEMVQFKECFVDEMEFADSVDCAYMHSLYDNVPKSSIVYDDSCRDEGMERMKKIAHGICNKYIKVGSEYEVNL